MSTRFFRAAMALAFAFSLPTPSNAGDLAAEAAALPIEHLADRTSAPGEGKEAFLSRDVAPVLRAFAEAHDAEACGVIASDGAGRWSVVLGTVGSRIGCVTSTRNVLPGFTATAETIHVHGLDKPVALNDADLVMVPEEYRARLASVGRRRPMIHGQDRDHFSPTDYDAGPGFLVTPDGLIYQHGAGTSVAVVAPATASSVQVAQAP
jgi:hypothetical protein